jgi:hypothetical protein
VTDVVEEKDGTDAATMDAIPLTLLNELQPYTFCALVLKRYVCPPINVDVVRVYVNANEAGESPMR